MAAGKSTIGKKLARRLDVKFYDLDDLIVDKHGATADIFATQGEAEFRRYEYEALSEVIGAAGAGVIALGGGAVTHEPSLTLLKKRTYRVFIKLSPAQILTRIRSSKNVRPLVGSAPKASEVEAIYARRLPLYLESDLVVEADRLSPARVVETITQWLRRESIEL